MLSYRAIEAWDEMVVLHQEMPGDVRDALLTRQQLALALNCRNGPGDTDRAIRELEGILKAHGDRAETLSILGRIYKDRFRVESQAGKTAKAAGWLDLAIETYARGFDAEPADYYPGVNALTLLLQKDGPEATAEIDRLTLLVTYAAVRQGGKKGTDYWTVATVLELACISRDYALASRCVPRVLILAEESWRLKTTSDNLALIAKRRAGEDGIEAVEDAARQLTKAAG